MSEIGDTLEIAIEALKKYAGGCKDRALAARIDAVREQVEDLQLELAGGRTTGVLRIVPDSGDTD